MRSAEPIFAVSGLESIRAQPRAMLSDPNGLTAGTMTRSSSPDRREERVDADDVHHARGVVGETGNHSIGQVFTQSGPTTDSRSPRYGLLAHRKLRTQCVLAALAA